MKNKYQMIGEGVNMEMNIGSVFKPSYPNSLRLSRKKNHREAEAHGSFFPSPSSVRAGRMVFSSAQTCTRSLKNMKYLKSKYVESRYQQKPLVEVSVYGSRLLLTCYHTNTLSCSAGNQN